VEYIVKLSETDEKGNFPCPSCHIVISPDDLSNNIYTIQAVDLKDEIPQAIYIHCHVCGTDIKLVCDISNEEWKQEVTR